MTYITSHVLDTTLGRPATGIRVRLERVDGVKSEEIASAVTDAEGRVRDWVTLPVAADGLKEICEADSTYEQLVTD